MPNTRSWPYRTDIVPSEPEFEAKVRAQSAKGTPISRDKAEWLKTRKPLNLHGFTPLKKETELAMQLLPYLEDPSQLDNIAPGKVYGVGPDGASAQTWAHEFRHLNNKELQEDSVRIRDAYYAGSPKQWTEAIRMWQDQTGEQDPAVAEQKLLAVLDNAAPYLTRENGAPDPGVLMKLFGSGHAKPEFAPYLNSVDRDKVPYAKFRD